MILTIFSHAHYPSCILSDEVCFQIFAYFFVFIIFFWHCLFLKIGKSLFTFVISFRYKICPIHNVFWRLISKGQWFWDVLPLLLFLKIQAQQKYPFHWPSLKSVPMFIICIPLFVPSLSCPFNYIFSFW